MTAAPTSARRADQIAALNDTFRRGFGIVRGIPGTFVITRGVAALSIEDRATVLRVLAQFDTFTADNDPYGEHDFAAFTVDGVRYNFKIDYYENHAMRYGAEDPLASYRVLTLMLAEEY